jgi:Concanavalin A-like lectin/glucanases superfamily
MRRWLLFLLLLPACAEVLGIRDPDDRIGDFAGSDASSSDAGAVADGNPACDPSLVALWHGEGNGAQSIGAGQPALEWPVANPNGFYRPGVVGQAFSVDQYSYPKSAAASAFGKFKTFTIALWAKPDGSSAAGSLFSLSSTDQTQGYSLATELSGNAGMRSRFVMRAASPLTFASALVVPVVDSTFFAVTVESSVDASAGIHVKLYTNGSSVQTDIGQPLPDSDLAVLALGGKVPWETGAHYAGLIDEVAFFSRALSDADLGALKRVPGGCP